MPAMVTSVGSVGAHGLARAIQSFQQRPALGDPGEPGERPAILAAPTESARPVEAAGTATEAGPLSRGEEPEKPSDGGEDLTEEEEKQVRDLKQRDQEVRAHEEAHAAVGGSYASAPKYEFTQGPDGKRYAVGGEVQIDTSAVAENPEATIRKMDVVIRAALAPAEPSSQDMAVARQAQQTRDRARAELARQAAEAFNGKDEATGGKSGAAGLLAADTAYRAAAGRAGSIIAETAKAEFSA
jgi:hypothetical protein